MWRERGGWGSEFHIEEATAFISIDATSPAHAQTLPFPFSPSVEHPAVHGVLVEAWPSPLGRCVYGAPRASLGARFTHPPFIGKRGRRAPKPPLREAPAFLSSEVRAWHTRS